MKYFDFICNECRFEKKNTADWKIEGPSPIHKSSVISQNHYENLNELKGLKVEILHNNLIIKDEIFNCPPVVVLTGRPADGWLATWSRAEAAVPRPIDPVVLAETVATLIRRRLAITS